MEADFNFTVRLKTDSGEAGLVVKRCSRGQKKEDSCTVGLHDYMYGNSQNFDESTKSDEEVLYSSKD